jgi:hypothetical protein
VAGGCEYYRRGVRSVPALLMIGALFTFCPLALAPSMAHGSQPPVSTALISVGATKALSATSSTGPGVSATSDPSKSSSSSAPTTTFATVGPVGPARTSSLAPVVQTVGSAAVSSSRSPLGASSTAVTSSKIIGTAKPSISSTSSSQLAPAKTVPDIVVRKGIAVLTVERVMAGGAFRFSVPPRTARPKTLEQTARKIARAGIDGSEALRPEVFFGLFTTASPAKRGADGVIRPLFCRRPVWVVRYPKVRSARQSGVIIPRNNKTATTIDQSVTTEIVVIIDDAKALEVRRSEYQPETKPPTPTSPVVCPNPEVPTTTKRSPVTTTIRGRRR